MKRLVSAIPALATFMAACMLMQPRTLVPTPPPGGAPSTGEYWALLVGIDTYRQELPLQAAVRDALEAREELVHRYGVQQEHIIELLNEQATRRNIEDALLRLSHAAKPEDTVLIYFAGHAQYDKDGRLEWLVPVDGQPQQPETLITSAAFRESTNEMKAKQVALFHLNGEAVTTLNISGPAPQVAREAQGLEKQQTEERAKLEAAQRQGDEERRPQAEEQAKQEAERLAQEQAASAEQQAERQRLEEERRRIAEEQAQREAEERARLDAEQLAREKEEQAAKLAQQKQLEEEQKRLAEEQARREADEAARREVERLVQEQAALAHQQAEQKRFEEKRKRLAEEQARQEAEEQAQREAEERARLDAERLAREKEEQTAKLAQQKQLEEEQKRLAEEQAQREAAAAARREAERLAQEQAALAEQRRLEEERMRLADRKARQEAEERAQQAAEQLAREREERAKLEAQLKRLEEERQRLVEEKSRQESERATREREQRDKQQAEQREAALREEAQRKLEERRRSDEQAKARAEQRSKPIEEARVRPFTPPTSGGELIGKDGAPMVLVPAGEFTMGGESIDNPRHPVYLDAFQMDKYEVTAARYARFLKASGRQPPYKWNDMRLVSHGDRPVIGVTWEDVDAYCRWAGKRLPTEAEWEKAARGPDGREYPWGNEAPTTRHANFNKCCDWKGYGTLAVVGSLEAGRSPYGIYDLAGNVSEWVADWYDKTAYKYELDRNPKGPADGEEKVVRGGSWYDAGPLQRSALRARSYPQAPSTDRGFRCAKGAK